MLLGINVPRPVCHPAPSDISWSRDLSLDEIYAIADYTQTGYRALNAALMAGKNPEGESATICALLDSVMSKAPEAESKRVLYRAQVLDKLPEVGDTFAFKAFASTSTNPALTPNYMSGEENEVIFEVLTSKGIDVNMYSAKQGREQEILLPRGSQYRVHNIIKTDWNVLYTDEEAGVSYDYCHLRNVTVVQLVDITE